MASEHTVKISKHIRKVVFLSRGWKYIKYEYTKGVDESEKRILNIVKKEMGKTPMLVERF